MEQFILIRKKTLLILITLNIFFYSYSQNMKCNNDIDTSLYEIIGIINEFYLYDTNNSHNIDSLIECFYSNEEKIVNHLKNIIKDYENNMRYNFLISERKSKEGHICLYSNSFNEFIYKYFIIDQTLRMDNFLMKEDRFKYSYLNGVYYRYGNCNNIYISNNLCKIKLILELMNSLHFKEVQIYQSKNDITPVSYIISFKPVYNPYIKIQDCINEIDLRFYKLIDIKDI